MFEDLKLFMIFLYDYVVRDPKTSILLIGAVWITMFLAYAFKHGLFKKESVAIHDLTYESLKLTANLVEKNSSFEEEIKSLKKTLDEVSKRIEHLQAINSQISKENEDYKNIIEYIYNLLDDEQKSNVDQRYPGLYAKN